LVTRVSSRLRAYLLIGAVGTLGALVLQRPEPVVVAAPFLLASAIGLALARAPRLQVNVGLDRERALEGDDVEVAVEVTALDPVAHLDVELLLPRGLRALAGEWSGGGGLRAGASRRFLIRLRCLRWGGRLVGGVRVRARDPLGFFHYEDEVRHLLPLRVYPRAETVQRLLKPADTQVFAGNEVSRGSGDGIEFAGIRPFVPGDRVRRINWRATARRGQLHVNELRPERNADVVIFLDTFSELRDGAESSLDLAVRAATALAHAYLQRRDRVGVIGFGGTLRWLRPEMGERQLYRILDALIDTEVVLSYAWKGLEVIPRQTLPPKALVLALTPLLDGRAVETLLDLRGRGHDLAVIEISPLPFLQPGRRPGQQLAYRLWAMERAELRGRFLALGVPAVPWSAGTPLQAALAAADRFRRDARVARA
jgi:uncharacterized protein (DUF58 family)